MPRRLIARTSVTKSVLAAGLLLLVGGPAAVAGVVDAPAVRRFQADHPTASVLEWGGQVAQLSRTVMSTGRTPDESVEAFLRRHVGVFGVDVNDLVPGVPYGDGAFRQPVMYDRENDRHRFTLLRYTQHAGEVPVFRSEIKLLVRNEPDHPLVLVNANLRDLRGFDPGEIRIDEARLLEIATRQLGLKLEIIEGPEPVVWAGVDAEVLPPRLALQFMVETPDATGFDDYRRWLFLVDAVNGAMLYDESQVFHVDVTGNISGSATQGIGADICESQAVVPLKHARVNILGGNVAYTDENGDYVIPHGGSGDVTVQSRLWGRWFRVFNLGGPDAVLEQMVTPPGPADFVHNQSMSEFTTAEVNAYVDANVIRDFTLFYDPAFPVIGTQQEFTCNVNIAESCNAFYNGVAINFFRTAGGCPNTSYSTIVHHEYGHHLVAVTNGAQGQWGEGMSDVMAVIITDDSRLAPGFFGNCDSPLRNADNDVQYPCQGGSHDCGRLISGCVWDLRNELIVTEPDDYRDILSTLAIGSHLLHNTGSTITPADAQNYVILDDDDNIPENGSPHWDEINRAFGEHNMAPPPLVLTTFEYPNGRPAAVDPDGGTRMRVEIGPFTANPIPGTGMLHYSSNGVDFIAVPMEELSDNIYDAVFPAYPCATELFYHLSVETDAARTQTDPVDAPDTLYETFAGVTATVVFEDNFETNMGWSVVNQNVSAGPWERGDPDGLIRAPFDDFDGSGQCYVTGLDRSTDLDGGPTRLVAPALDMSSGEFRLTYARWAGGINGTGDTLEVELSNDGGNSWTTAESIPTSNSPAWVPVELRVGDVIQPTADMLLRFSMTDVTPDSTCEGGVDAVSVTQIECGSPSVVLPSSVAVQLGRLEAGGLEQLFNSDDSYFVVKQRAALTPLLPNIRVELEGTAPTDSPSTLTFSLEASATALPPTVPQRIQLFNYDTSSWETVDERLATLSDSVVDVVISTNPERYVEDGTGGVAARLSWFNPGNVLSPNWDANIDRAAWRVD